MTRETIVRDAFTNQSDWCKKLGSPFTAMLLLGVASSLDKGSETGKTILEWDGPPDAMGDSVPLRLAGALHALIRAGKVPELAALYPPNPLPDKTILSRTAMATIKQFDKEILSFIQHPPQTNEVGRSAILYLGFMEIAKRTNLPLALYEIGASGGLNLFPDKFAYQFGEIKVGQAGSHVILSPKFSGEMKQIIEPEIISRSGCDKNPLDIVNNQHVERMMAYIWPDQPQRLSRVQEAIKIAQLDPLIIEKTDALDWVEEFLAKPPKKGVVRVLFHSIAFQYFPKKSQQRITSLMQQAGENVALDTPLVWLSFENDDESAKLTLKLWPNGKVYLLAKADAHVSWIDWQ